MNCHLSHATDNVNFHVSNETDVVSVHVSHDTGELIHIQIVRLSSFELDIEELFIGYVTFNCSISRVLRMC